jgi:hypothetical protein
MRSRVTGSLGSSSAASVNVQVVGPNPLPVSIASGISVQKGEFHDCSVTEINAAGGSWAAVGSGAAMSKLIQKVQMSSTIGIPIEFGVGPNSGSVTRAWVANQGEGPQVVDVALASGTHLFVRSLNASTASSGYLTVNLEG